MDLPGPALKAILERAGPGAAASLRAASRDMRANASDAVAGLSITLTRASTRADVDAWLRTTRRLAHTPALAVTVVGAVPFGPVDALFARLAVRGMPAKILLRGGSSSSSSSSSGGDGGESPLSLSSAAAAAGMWVGAGEKLEQRQPHGTACSVPAACLAHLAGVQHLTLRGVALRRGDDDDDAFNGAVAGAGTEAAAPAAPAAPAAKCSPVLEPLVTGARSLARLELGPGWAGHGASLDNAAAALTALAALPWLAELSAALPPVALARPPAALAGLVGAAGDAAAETRASLERLVAALVPLHGLRALSLSGLPDVWGGPFATGSDWDDDKEEDEDEGEGEGGERAPATLEGLAATFSAAMPRLRRLDAALVGGWAMSWAEGDDGASDASSAGGAATHLQLRAVDAVVHLGARPSAAAAGSRIWAGSSNNGNSTAVADGILAALAPYVAAAGDGLPRRAALVRSLHLSIAAAGVPGLAPALALLPALRRLRVTVLATSAQGSAPLDPLVAAVALGAPAGLEALALCPGLGLADIGPATFAPLAASAGTTSGRLAALKLVGALRVAAAAAEAEAAWAPLASLAKLHALAVTNVAPAHVPLPESALPSGLVDLELRGLRLLPLALAGDAAAATRATPPPLAELRSVALVNCDAGDMAASRLAGALVAKAFISDTRLGGEGWRGVAAAWPALASLTALPPNGGGASSSASAAADALLGALPAMRRLEALTVHRLPALDDAALAALAGAPALRRLAVTAAECALTQDAAVLAQAAGSGGGAAAAASSSSPRVPAQIKALTLQLPACRLPPHLVTVLNGGGSSESGSGNGSGSDVKALPWWSLPGVPLPNSGSDSGREWAGPGGALRKALAAAFPGANARVALNQLPPHGNLALAWRY